MPTPSSRQRGRRNLYLSRRRPCYLFVRLPLRIPLGRDARQDWILWWHDHKTCWLLLIVPTYCVFSNNIYWLFHEHWRSVSRWRLMKKQKEKREKVKRDPRIWSNCSQDIVESLSCYNFVMVWYEILAMQLLYQCPYYIHYVAHTSVPSTSLFELTDDVLFQTRKPNWIILTIWNRRSAWYTATNSLHTYLKWDSNNTKENTYVPTK